MRLKLTDIDICGFYSHGLNMPEVCAYKYIFNRKKDRRNDGEIISICPLDYRQWIAKNSHNGKTISIRHSSRAIENLCDRGFGEIVRRGFGRIELKLYSLDLVFGRICADLPNMPNPDPVKADDIDAQQKKRVKQQQLILTKEICTKAGINYRLEKDWWEVASHGIEKIKATVERMLLQMSTSRTQIYNPCGWFKVALKDNYYLDAPTNTGDSILLLESMYFQARDKLLNLTGCLPKKIGSMNCNS